MKLTKKKDYYEGIVYEFNLPTGWSCPMADECLVKVERKTGKQDNKSKGYKCYAASAERFPAVRDLRWHNFEFMRKKPTVDDVTIDPKVKNVRLHASGDFFSQAYFDLWLQVCRKYPTINFWTYTKSITYWLNRIDEIPDNLILNASLGGTQDHLIDKSRMKFVEISTSLFTASFAVCKKDDLARIPFRHLQRFTLVDNYSSDNKKAKQTAIKMH